MASNKPEIEKEYIKILRPCLHFHGIQIKSIQAFRDFSAGVEAIESVAGIHECTISLEEIFVCPWIDFDDIEDQTEMEVLLIGIINNLKTNHSLIK